MTHIHTLQACLKVEQAVLRLASELAVACVDKVFNVQALMTACPAYELEEDAAHQNQRKSLQRQAELLENSIMKIKNLQAHPQSGESHCGNVMQYLHGRHVH